MSVKVEKKKAKKLSMPEKHASVTSGDAALQEAMIGLITRHQNQLYHYILSLVLDHNAADDLLQETHLTVYRKASEFDLNTSYLAWARKIAYFHVLEYRRKQARLGKKHILVDETLDMISHLPVEKQGDSTILEALKKCMKKLPARQAQLIKARYLEGQSVKVIAESVSRSSGAISQALYETRNNLQRCIEKQVKPQ